MEHSDNRNIKLWHQALSAKDQARVLAMPGLLEKEGPQLGRPYADTIKGSRFSNMKELRIQSRETRCAFFTFFHPSAKASCCVRAIRLAIISVFMTS